MMCAHKTNLTDLRKPLKATNAQLRDSLCNLMQVIPGISQHVEEVRHEVEGFRGKSVKTYVLDDVALAAFLYWRRVHGRLPLLFKHGGNGQEANDESV